MRVLEALSHSHGGKFTIQSGTHTGEHREYWLIYHSLQRPSVGAITHSAEIHSSWAMRHQLEEDPNWRRKLQVYSLVYLLEGGGTFFEERLRSERSVAAGDLLCLFPNIAHVYAPHDGTRWNEINVEFSGLVFDAWMGAGLLDPENPVRHLEPVAYWNRRFHEVVVPLAKEDGHVPLIDAASLIGLIAEMCSTWIRPLQEADVRWAERARKQLLTLPPGQPLDQIRMVRSFGLGD